MKFFVIERAHKPFVLVMRVSGSSRNLSIFLYLDIDTYCLLLLIVFLQNLSWFSFFEKWEMIFYYFFIVLLVFPLLLLLLFWEDDVKRSCAFVVLSIFARKVCKIIDIPRIYKYFFFLAFSRLEIGLGDLF